MADLSNDMRRQLVYEECDWLVRELVQTAWSSPVGEFFKRHYFADESSGRTHLIVSLYSSARHYLTALMASDDVVVFTAGSFEDHVRTVRTMGEDAARLRRAVGGAPSAFELGLEQGWGLPLVNLENERACVAERTTTLLLRVWPEIITDFIDCTAVVSQMSDSTRAEWCGLVLTTLGDFRKDLVASPSLVVVSTEAFEACVKNAYASGYQYTDEDEWITRSPFTLMKSKE